MRTNNDFNFIKKEEHNMSKDRTPHAPEQRKRATTKNQRPQQNLLHYSGGQKKKRDADMILKCIIE